MDEKPVQGDVSRAVGPRYQPLVLAAVAVCTGIVADRYLAWPVVVWWAVGALAWSVWWWLWRRQWDRAAGAAVLLAAAACGGAWHHCRWNLFQRDDLGLYTREREQPICLEAVALAGPRRILPSASDAMRFIPASDRTRVEMEVVALRNGSQWEPASGCFRVTVNGRLPEFRAGDRLRIFAQFARPQRPRNPGEFDFAVHHRSDRLLCTLRAEFPDCVSLVEPGCQWNVRRWIDAVRTAGDRLVWRHLDPRRAGVASAVLLGCREEVTAEQTEAFVQTGTVHILSISGMHVGILAALVLLAMRLLPVSRGLASLITAAVVVLYTLLADAQPPAVRAMVLVLVMCGAFWRGRRALAMNSLGAAALVVLAINPADLFRSGVQLSFLCMMVLMWLPSLSGPRDATQAALERLIRQSRPWPLRALSSAGRRVWELALAGAAIWIVTAPLVAARFHLFSPIALVLNILLWVPMTLTIWSGFALITLGALCPYAAPVLGSCCDGTIAVLQSSIDAARKIPHSYFWVPGPADWWLIGLYAGLGVMLAWPRVRPPRRWFAALVALWAAVGFGAPLVNRDRPHLACTVASLGHGCGTVLQTPSGATLLYDAGSLTSSTRAANAISACLWSQGIMHLDAVLLSHPDADHYNAVPELLERFSVGAIYVPPNMFESDEPALIALDEAIRRANIPVSEIYAGDRLSVGRPFQAVSDALERPSDNDSPDCRIEVLHPPRGGLIGGDNANSLVLTVEHQGKRILLTGDLESPGLDDVLAEEPLHCDVLLAPHHGSRGSDPPGLARWCSPRFAIISGALTFNVAEATATYRAAGAEVLHTANQGAITVRIDDRGLDIATWLDCTQSTGGLGLRGD